MIQRNIARSKDEVTSFEDLEKCIPNIRISGYDANTRNKVEGKNTLDLWKHSSIYEVDGLKQFPLGATRITANSTYKSDTENRDTTPDLKKRIGYTVGGSLDFVDIYFIPVKTHQLAYAINGRNVLLI